MLLTLLLPFFDSITCFRMFSLFFTYAAISCHDINNGTAIPRALHAAACWLILMLPYAITYTAFASAIADIFHYARRVLTLLLGGGVGWGWWSLSSILQGGGVPPLVPLLPPRV